MISVTGGSGKLGGILKKLLPGDLYPTHEFVDICDLPFLLRFVDRAERDHTIKTVIHAAAFTSPPKVDNDPYDALQTNIVGTSNIVSLCMIKGFRLVYVSTDYVFDGGPNSYPGDNQNGAYKEEDAVHPINKYAWSKLGGECAVRMMKANWAIVRCSMGPVPFPYDKAPVDQYTSRQPISIIAEKIVKIAKSDFCGVIHIGGKRQTVYDYAKEISPDKEIEKMLIKDMPSKTPYDTSLNTSLWQSKFGDKNEK